MLLTKPAWAGRFDFCPVITDLGDATGGDVLLCIFGPIVPPDVLARYGAAYNLHPGPLNHPGRDPHHWAIYDGDQWFGVTLHCMTARVDAGKPLQALVFPITRDRSPLDLRDAANEIAVFAMNHFGPLLLAGCALPGGTAVEGPWSGHKRSRADLLRMCDLRGLDEAEVARRRHAFQGFEAHFITDPA